MSLIEKAVSKLTNVSSDAVALPDFGARASPSPNSERPKSIIEKFSEVAPAERSARTPTPAQAPYSGQPVAPASRREENSKREVVRLHLESLRARGFVTPDGNQTQISQEFRERFDDLEGIIGNEPPKNKYEENY